MKEITLIPVSSSNVAGYLYEPATGMLYVAFWRRDSKPVDLYIHKSVPGSVANELDLAHSKGRTFYHRIRNQYESEKVMGVVVRGIDPKLRKPERR